MKRILILVSFFLNLSMPLALEVNLGVEDSWPPYADENGEGISSDIIIHAYKEVGVKVNLRAYPYSRVLEMTKRGELDGCLNVPIDSGTKGQYIFGEEPILETKASLYYRAGTGYKDGLVKGDKVALMRGFQYGDDFEKNKHHYQQTRVNTQEQILKILIRERVDVGILSDGSAQYHINRLKLHDKIKKGTVQLNLKVFIAFSKKNKNSKHLAELFDEGVRKLKKKGLYQSFFIQKKKDQEKLAHNR